MPVRAGRGRTGPPPATRSPQTWPWSWNDREPARAERLFRTYLTREPEIGAPTHAHAQWRLGLVIEKQGRRAEALAAVETALRLKPDLDDAKKDLKRLKKS